MDVERAFCQTPKDVIPVKAGIYKINHLQIKEVTSQKVRALFESAQGRGQPFRDA